MYIVDYIALKPRQHITLEKQIIRITIIFFPFPLAEGLYIFEHEWSKHE